MKCAVLCADSEALRHPDALGLPDENLEAQPWLKTFSDAGAARAYLAGARTDADVWVAGSDQVDAINLAAAIRRDGGSPALVAFQGSGSLYSRAYAAGIGKVLGKQEFLQRYGVCKQAASLGGRPATEEPAVSAAPSAVPDPFAGFSKVVADQEAYGETAGGSARPATSAYPAAAPQVVAPSVCGAAAASPQPAAQTRAGVEGDAVAARPVLSAPVATSSKAQVITVVGAGGGMGKSTLAVICACLAQQRGYRTVVLDADLQGGDVHYLMGKEDALRIDALIAEPARVGALQAEGPLPAVVAAPDAVEKSEVVAPLVKDVCALLGTRFDVVVVNTSPTWTDVQMDLIGISSRVLFVLDQRPTALRLCKRVLDLCGRCGVASRSFVMALNRCSRQSLFSSIDVSCALSGIHAVELREGGRGLSEALGSGAPLDAVDAGNAFCESVRDLLDEVLPPVEGQAAERPRKRRRLRGRGKK